MFQLSQFALFQSLQAQLSAITSEQLVTVEAGDPLKGNEQVIGTLPDHLKALLYLRDQISDKANKFVDTLPREFPSPEALEKLVEFKQASKKANDLFWDAFRAEFPNLADKTSVGYGPNFEVYSSDTPAVQNRRPSLADILRGGLLMQVG